MNNIADIIKAANCSSRRSNKSTGHPVGCTPSQIDDLLELCEHTFGIAPCQQYIEMLRMLDGIMYDGNTIYAHKTHPLFGPGAVTSRAVGSPDIDGFVELNNFWRERCEVPPDALVYGGNEIYLFVGFREERFCLVPDEALPGENLICHIDLEFASFNEMLHHIFRHLLERARDRGELR